LTEGGESLLLVEFSVKWKHWISPCPVINIKSPENGDIVHMVERGIFPVRT
jgi:hypothetical protein